MSEHQVAFDALKIALTTAPVVGYPDFTKEFILETDASLKGLKSVLSLQDDTSKVCLIAYVSWTLMVCKAMMSYINTYLNFSLGDQYMCMSYILIALHSTTAHLCIPLDLKI